MNIEECLKVDSKELFNEAVIKSKESMKELNPYVTIINEYKHINSDSLVNGVTYALKDNFSTKGILTTGSSNIFTFFHSKF